MDSLGEDVHNEFTILRTFDKMWLETMGVQDHKQHMFILQLLGKKGLCCWESFPIASPNNNDKEQPDHIWEAIQSFLR